MKTLNEIILSLTESIRTRFPEIDINNTTVKDLLVLPNANEIHSAYNELAYILQLMSIVNAANITDEDFDRFAANFGIVRKGGTYAYGKIRFYRYLLPETSIFIPENTVVSTRQTLITTGLQFITLQSAIFSEHTVQFDPDYNAYFIEIPIRSVDIGSRFNVPSKAINTIVSNIRGIDFILNVEPTYGGTDKETNIDLARRIQLANVGSHIGTKKGYEKLVLDSEFPVRDIKVLDFKDTEFSRERINGAVDIIVITDQTAIATEKFVYFSTLSNYRLSHQPVVKNDRNVILSYINEQGETVILEMDTDTETKDYKIIYDLSGMFAYSPKANTYIDLHPRHSIPDGTVMTIQYEYYNLVESIQDFVTSEENKIVGHDVLVRHAFPKVVNIKVTVKLLTGYFISDVGPQIKDKLILEFKKFKIGQMLQRSDLIDWIYQVEGVDSINLNTLEPLSDVFPLPLEYLVTSQDNIVVTVL